jgi:hypothetical protein
VAEFRFFRVIYLSHLRLPLVAGTTIDPVLASLEAVCDLISDAAHFDGLDTPALNGARA